MKLSTLRSVCIAAALSMLSIGAHATPPAPLPTIEVSGAMVSDPAWISYRTAKRAIRIFEEYTGPKDQILPRYLLDPLQPDQFNFDGLRFGIEDDETIVPLPQMKGWALVPLHPSIDADQARFVVNRPQGSVKLKYMLTLLPQRDQRYEVGYLQSGCVQMFDLHRTQTLFLRIKNANKQCTGVRIALLDSESKLLAVDLNGETAEIPSEPTATGRKLEFRWRADVQAVQVVPPGAPHVITMLVE